MNKPLGIILVPLNIKMGRNLTGRHVQPGPNGGIVNLKRYFNPRNAAKEIIAEQHKEQFAS